MLRYERLLEVLQSTTQSLSQRTNKARKYLEALDGQLSTEQRAELTELLDGYDRDVSSLYSATRPQEKEPYTNHPLSQREVEILGLIAEGMTNQQIADRLIISIKTVKQHKSNIFPKIGVYDKTQAALWYLKHEPLGPPVYSSIENLNRDIKSLTPREEKIMELLSKNYKAFEIAKELGIRIHIVKKGLQDIYKKIGTSGPHPREQAIRWYNKTFSDMENLQQ